MQSDTNKVIITGRLTRPADLKTTPSGTYVSNFSIAVNKRKKVNNNWVDFVHYVDCVYWGDRAKNIHPYLGKGQQLNVTGELEQNRWEQDGQKRSKIEIFVLSLQLMGSTKENSGSGGYQGHPDSHQNPPQGGQGQPPGSFEDDIPF